MLDNHSSLVSVIVVCKNESTYIADCVEAILNQQLNNSALEVIVVDGKSDDGSMQILTQKYASQITILNNENGYTPHGINMGIQAAKGNYIAIVGARSILSSEYLAHCIQHLNNHKKTWCVGGKIIQAGSDNVSNSIAIAMSSAAGVGLFNFRTIHKSRKVDTVSCPVMPKHVIQSIGLFDESFIRNQDDDYSFRIIKAGGEIFQLSNIHSTYFVRQQFSQLYKQYFQYGFWKILLNKKHRTVTSLRQLFPAMFILSGLVTFLFISLNIAIVEFFLYLLIISLTALYNLRKKPGSFLLIIKSIITIHMAYGLGYWYGIWEILVKNNVPQKLKTLSR